MYKFIVGGIAAVLALLMYAPSGNWTLMTCVNSAQWEQASFCNYGAIAAVVVIAAVVGVVIGSMVDRFLKNRKT